MKLIQSYAHKYVSRLFNEKFKNNESEMKLYPQIKSFSAYPIDSSSEYARRTNSINTIAGR